MKNKIIFLTFIFTSLITLENSSQAYGGGAVAGGLIGGAVVGSAIANSRSRRYDDEYAYRRGREDARREQFYREQRARENGW